ncbi:MAG: HEAT repeat domain-containing protein, partial [Candidatus Kariarchaeaceae archaeon]
MADVADLLEQARDEDKKQRKNAAKELGKLDVQYESVMTTLQDLAANDDDKGVRKEAEKSLNNLSSKPLESASVTKEVEMDDSTDEYSLEEGEFDVDSSMDKREEDRLEMQAEGKGLMVQLKEENFVTMDYYGEIQGTEQSTGSIAVANSGSKDRITGVDLILKNAGNVRSETELSDKINIGLLRPGMDNAWRANYEFDAAPSPIKVEQDYVDPENGLSPNFAGGAEPSFEAQIIITNTTDSVIYNLKAEKMLNEHASLTGSNSSKGSVNASADMVEFTLEELPAGESVT